MRPKDTVNQHPGMAFQKAYAHLHEISAKEPAWFDMARVIMKKVSDGEQLTLGALTEGLIQAHAMGVKGELPEQDPEMVPYRKADQPPPRVRRTART